MIKRIMVLTAGTFLVAAAAGGSALAAHKGTAVQIDQTKAQMTDMSAQRRWRHGGHWRHARAWRGYGYRPYYAYRRHWAPYYAYGYPYGYYRPGPSFGFRFGPVGFGIW